MDNELLEKHMKDYIAETCLKKHAHMYQDKFNPKLFSSQQKIVEKSDVGHLCKKEVELVEKKETVALSKEKSGVQNNTYFSTSS